MMLVAMELLTHPVIVRHGVAQSMGAICRVLKVPGSRESVAAAEW